MDGLIMETPIKMDDLGGTTIFGNIHIVYSEFKKTFFFAKKNWKK